jgi:transcriptional regulator with XRE-family HTH domain
MQITPTKTGLFGSLVALQATPATFARFVESLKLLRDYTGWSDQDLAERMGVSRQWAWKRRSEAPKDLKVSTLIKLCAALSEFTPPLEVTPSELLEPDLIHIKLASVRQIQTQESVNLRTPGLTGSDRPSSYTPATNVPSEVRGITDVAQIVADISQLQREVSALKKDLGDNTLVLFGAFRALRLRFNSAVPTADQSHEVATSTDRQSTGTSGRTGRPRKHHGKGRG